MEVEDMRELRTAAEFAEAVELGGVIVIRDEANRSSAKLVAHLHTAAKACSHVDADHFNAKVVDNVGKNGAYWWTRNSKIAERALGAVLCTESTRLLGRA